MNIFSGLNIVNFDHRSSASYFNYNNHNNITLDEIGVLNGRGANFCSIPDTLQAPHDQINQNHHNFTGKLLNTRASKISIHKIVQRINLTTIYIIFC